MSLLTPELLRRLEQFQLLAARRAKSSAKGERRSRARGQSVEFADYRNYVAGDDFRYLDWNLFGRLDRLFLKLYEEERELPVTIFLDASESMAFGEPRKFDFARQIAAALHERKGTVGKAVLRELVSEFVKPIVADPQILSTDRAIAILEQLLTSVLPQLKESEEFNRLAKSVLGEEIEQRRNLRARRLEDTAT